MDIQQLAKKLNLGRDGTYFRMWKLGIKRKDIYSENDFEKLIEYKQKMTLHRYRVSDLEFYEYFITNKENSLNTMSKLFDIPLPQLSYRLNKIIKTGFVTVPSKINLKNLDLAECEKSIAENYKLLNKV